MLYTNIKNGLKSKYDSKVNGAKNSCKISSDIIIFSNKSFYLTNGEMHETFNVVLEYNYMLKLNEVYRNYQDTDDVDWNVPVTRCFVLTSLLNSTNKKSATLGSGEIWYGAPINTNWPYVEELIHEKEYLDSRDMKNYFENGVYVVEETGPVLFRFLPCGHEKIEKEIDKKYKYLLSVDDEVVEGNAKQITVALKKYGLDTDFNHYIFKKE